MIKKQIKVDLNLSYERLFFCIQTLRLLQTIVLEATSSYQGGLCKVDFKRGVPW